MNRPASTYVIIAHFTVSGDFSQSKREEEKERGSETASGDQGSSPSKPCKQWYLSNTEMAFWTTADDFWALIPPPLCSSLPNKYLQGINNLNQGIEGLLSSVNELL